MPKQTFYNLPEDKKQLLLEALEAEFSRVPFFEASISNIVKIADIPRGSFYQYFEDKEDAYFYLLNAQAEGIKETFVEHLKDNDGDLFQTMYDLYKWTLKEISKSDGINLLRNAFLNMTHKTETTFYTIFNGKDHNQLDEISCLINKHQLNIDKDSDLLFVMKIISSVTFHNLIEKLAKNISDEEALNNYCFELKLLKEGLIKK